MQNRRGCLGFIMLSRHASHWPETRKVLIQLYASQLQTVPLLLSRIHVNKTSNEKNTFYWPHFTDF